VMMGVLWVEYTWKDPSPGATRPPSTKGEVKLIRASLLPWEKDWMRGLHFKTQSLPG
jgi:hypothetical protein